MVIQIIGAIVIVCSLATKNGLGFVCGLVMVMAGCFWGENNFEK